MKTYYDLKYTREVGCDEAGRGCLAGPVVAAAVCWPQDLESQEIIDSKKLNFSARNELAEYIKQNAIAFAIGIASPEEIDQINILKASFLAMHRAIDQIKMPIDILLIDGPRFVPYRDIPNVCIVKGDNLYTSIAAASILAKTTRDQIMHQLHNQHPEYLWDQNMGYPTIKHKLAIAQHGLTPHHRKTFKNRIGTQTGQLNFKF